MIVMKGLIRLWRNTESNFLGNEFVLSECTKCTITEELQGSFILELEYPLNDKKGLSEYLRNRNETPIAPILLQKLVMEINPYVPYCTEAHYQEYFKHLQQSVRMVPGTVICGIVRDERESR